MKKKALIISGIFWQNTWQRHHNIAQSLLGLEYDVDFISGVKSSGVTVKKVVEIARARLSCSNCQMTNKNQIPNSGFREFSTFNLPYNILSTRASNNLLSKLNHRKYDLVICYIPSPLSLKLISSLEYETLIYDCVRSFSDWEGVSKNILISESKLLKLSDQVWVDSFYLKDKMEKKHSLVEQFLPTINKDYNFKFKDTKKITKLAFFGSVSHHFDLSILPILESIDIQLNVWGVDEMNISQDYSCVKFMGYCVNEDELLTNIYRETEGVIIPYKGNMDGVIPAKLIQSLATKLPVFVSSFYDSEYLTDYLYVYKNNEELLQLLGNFAKNQHLDKLNQIEKLVLNNTNKRFHQKIAEIINNTTG